MHAVHGRRHGCGDGQLQPELDDVPRGHVRARLEQAGRAADCQVNPVSDARTVGLADLPLLFPDANVHQSRLLRVRALNGQAAGAVLGRDARICKAPNFTWGNRIAKRRAAQRRATRLRSTQPDVGSLRQPDESGGPAHAQDRLLPHHSLKREIGGAATFGNNFGDVSFANDTANAFDTTFGFANAAIGSFTVVHPGVSYTSRATTSTPTSEVYVQDNWKVNRQADARLRHPLRARDAAVRQAATGRQFPAGSSGRARPRRRVYVFGCATGV